MIDLYHLQILAVHLVLSIVSFPQPQRDVVCVHVWVIQVDAWGGMQGCDDVWTVISLQGYSLLDCKCGGVLTGFDTIRLCHVMHNH